MADNRKSSKCLIAYHCSSTTISLVGEFWGGPGGGGAFTGAWEKFLGRGETPEKGAPRGKKFFLK